MKLTAQIKLKPMPEQYASLKDTLEKANAACNYISQRAFIEEEFKQFGIHRLVYKDVRATFNLSAQVVIRAISKVADSYKISRKKQRGFKKHGAIAYDARILSFKLNDRRVSIWTISGRQKMPFQCSDRAYELLQGKRGESDLCFIRGEFYLFVSCDVDTPEPTDVEGYLGIDTGIVSIAYDSDGKQFSGSHVNSVRMRRSKQRQSLQSAGTKSAKRRLKKLSGKEARFAKDVNHQISKAIVNKAKDTTRGIALENLKGIRKRVTVRKSQRYRLHSWGFNQLQSFIEYKAKLSGVPVVYVDPKYTSQACSVCGHVSKSNRKSQDTFLCVRCGYADHADHNAAINISCRADVNLPIVGEPLLAF